MRIRIGMSWLAVASVIAIGLAAVVFATPNTVQVKFVNPSGAPIPGGTVGVYVDGQMVQKVQATMPGDTYTIVAEKGQKLKFELEDPAVGKVMTEAKIPQLFQPPLLIVAQQPAAPMVTPVNDLCDDAIAVGPLPAIVSGTTIDATLDQPPTPDCSGFPSGSSIITTPGVWYEFTGTGNLVTASLCNANTAFDTKLGIYCLDCDEPTCVDGNDDGAPAECGLESFTESCTQMGKTYRVLVHGFGGQTGDFDLELTDTGIACDAPVDCTPPMAVGACCDCDAPPFNCSVVTEADCMAQGAEYEGDLTECFGTAPEPWVYASSPFVDIPDSDANGVPDTIFVADNFVVGEVEVALDIEHTWIGDLIVTLTHGNSVVIWNRVCSLEDNLFAGFDDDGDPVVCASPTVGVIDPVSADGEPLDGLVGDVAMGDWTLTVSDNAGGDVGVLNGWQLTLYSGAPTCSDQNDGSCFLCPAGGDDEDEDEDSDVLAIPDRRTDEPSARTNPQSRSNLF